MGGGTGLNRAMGMKPNWAKAGYEKAKKSQP
ncbi:hypothetical protein CCACVL1_21965 [Corchorus capsularis]|uniref:Uncharacterized protein n=1 Tax=Corchorus capsularis TaxID=210143 RepID=A0A1R3H1H0_COCAP|nr:hypothetical protein CCACVL1_21965 [Corchorus capsularis]